MYPFRFELVQKYEVNNSRCEDKQTKVYDDRRRDVTEEANASFQKLEKALIEMV